MYMYITFFVDHLETFDCHLHYKHDLSCLTRFDYKSNYININEEIKTFKFQAMHCIYNHYLWIPSLP